MLDAEEYLHLALHASSIRDHHSCLRYLYEVLRLQPQHGAARYLLAVQHAELGLGSRAVAGLKEALALDPGMDLARFQLGCMLQDLGRGEEAVEQFKMLRASRDEALRDYSEALIALGAKDQVRAREKLALGLSRKPANTSLATAMRRLLEYLSGSTDPAKAEPGASESVRDGVERPADHMFLGAYRDNAS